MGLSPNRDGVKKVELASSAPRRADQSRRSPIAVCFPAGREMATFVNHQLAYDDWYATVVHMEEGDGRGQCQVDSKRAGSVPTR